MKPNRYLVITLLAVVSVASHSILAQQIRPLADDFVVVFESPDPGKVFCYTPGLCRLPSGRLVATLDLGGPGVASLPGAKADVCTEKGSWQGKILTSDDGGKSWQLRAEFPLRGLGQRFAGLDRLLLALGNHAEKRTVANDLDDAFHLADAGGIDALKR